MPLKKIWTPEATSFEPAKVVLDGAAHEQDSFIAHAHGKTDLNADGVRIPIIVKAIEIDGDTSLGASFIPEKTAVEALKREVLEAMANLRLAIKIACKVTPIHRSSNCKGDSQNSEIYSYNKYKTGPTSYADEPLTDLNSLLINGGKLEVELGRVEFYIEEDDK